MPCNAPSLALKILPSNPVPAESGRIKLFAKADGLYTIDAAGNVLPVDLNASAFALTLLDDPDAASMRSTLGIVIGTNVQAHSSDLDAFVTNALWVGSALTLAGSLTATQLTASDIISNGTIFAGGDLSGTGNVTFSFGSALFDGNITSASGLLELQGVTIIPGNGDPEGAVAANPGSLFLRGDSIADHTLYVKESGAGNTGWRRVATLAP
jgi:hypothetical protein